MSLALVLGCGENVWSDAACLLEMCTPDAYIAVKDMMIKWPGRVDLGVTLHPDRTPGYLKERKALGRNIDFEVWAHKQPHARTGPHSTTDDWQGSSGLLAVKVAIEHGFDGIVLAGVPMDPVYGHVARHKQWISAQIFQRGWKVHLALFKSKTRSMSGWTKDLLGEPSPSWLEQVKAAPPDHIMVDLIKSSSTTRSI